MASCERRTISACKESRQPIPNCSTSSRELVRNNWSLKHLHRLIMASNTYRMAATATPAQALSDPDARWLSRFPRRRLEAEIVWDHLHAASGTLNLEMYGPAVVPPIDSKALDTLIHKNWKISDDPAQFNRRGIYLVVRRSITLPFFETFNMSLPIESQGRRDNTVVSSQALTMLNGPVAIEQARYMAGRLLRECNAERETLISRGWLLAFQRSITSEERQAARDYLSKREEALTPANPKDLATALGNKGSKSVSSPNESAVVEWCLALLNASEFFYID